MLDSSDYSSELARLAHAQFPTDCFRIFEVSRPPFTLNSISIEYSTAAQESLEMLGWNVVFA